MRNFFVLKDINFLEFKRVLKKNSQKYGYEVKEKSDVITFCWDFSPTATVYCIDVSPIGVDRFVFSIQMDNFIPLTVFLWLFFLILFKQDLLSFFITSFLITSFLWAYSYYYIRKKVLDLFLLLDDKEILEEDEIDIINSTLVCPACGEPLTEYDEYCPGCGLFLGKVKRKQPASRTGYLDKRINYVFKRNNPAKN